MIAIAKPATLQRAGLAAAALVALLIAVRVWGTALRDPAMLTGGVLLALVFVLAAYGAKKALPFLPLGGSTAWMHLHSWAGFLAVAAYGLHAGVRVPTGVLETLLALSFVLVAASGIAGLALARVLPPMLRARGEPILFSRIPALRRTVADRAAALAAPSRVLADHHRLHLAAWLEAPGDALHHLRGSRVPMQRRLEHTEALFRYLTPEEQTTARELMDLIKQKDLLDAHHALQTALRAWTLIHVPVTGALVLLGVAHALTVVAFRGGL